MQNVKGRPDTHDCNEKDYKCTFYISVFFISNELFLERIKLLAPKSLNENECQTC